MTRCGVFVETELIKKTALSIVELKISEDRPRPAKARKRFKEQEKQPAEVFFLTALGVKIRSVG